MHIENIKNLYFIFVIIFSGLAIPLYFSNPFGLVWLFGLGIILFSEKIRIMPKKLFVALGIWLIYFIINMYFTKHFNRFFLIQVPIKIIIAWLVISHWKSAILRKYENAIYLMTLFSLFFFIWQIIHPVSVMQLLDNFDIGGRSGANIIVYTSINYSMSDLLPRNCGFSWEPGPFSGFLLLAIVINLSRTNFKLKNNVKLWIFILALITTQSSTGLIGLLAIIFWFAYNKFKSKIMLVWLPIVTVFVYFLFVNVPFLSEKIQNESNQDYEQIIQNSEFSENSVALGRFASFQVLLKDFLKYPFTGTGGAESFIGFKSQSPNVGLVNGVGRIIASFGIFGIVLYLYLVINAGQYIANYFCYLGHWIFAILIFIIGFGFSIIETPIFFIFYFLPVFDNRLLMKRGKSFIISTV